MKYLFKNLREIDRRQPHKSATTNKAITIFGAFLASGAIISSQVLILPIQPVHAQQAGICPVAGKDGIGNITGIINTYYPGAAETVVPVGATSIPVGTINPNGNQTPIQKGDLLILIQMQDADINSTDTDAYGDGVGGDVSNDTANAPPPVAASGYTNLNNTGHYEYFVADGGVTNGAIPIKGTTKNSYRNQKGTTAHGQRTYQVVRVPQYTNATVSGTLTTAAQWDGASGGIVAVDVKEELNFSAGSVVDVNGLGFRGGGSNPNPYSGGSKSPSPFRTITSGIKQGDNAPKGEGIAGTPRIVSTQPFGQFNVRSTTVTTDLNSPNYPNGDEGRGAPGNAGGGGNEHNSGGGGGANGGSGGMGGRSFNGFGANPPQFDAFVGGFGGKAIAPDPLRLMLGGGGGAGDTNDQSEPSGAGGGGGGIVIIRAGSVTGNGTINAKGANGINSPQGANPDAGGGGGAGGTVLVATASGNVGGLTINATGGVGGNLHQNDTSELDGPGGGGGGGAVYTTGGAAVDTSGGEPGKSTNNTGPRNNTPNGATPGSGGINQPVSLSELTTSISGSASNCYNVSGTLYEDTNKDEDFDAGETTLPSAIQVTLYKDTNNNNIVDSGEEIANTLTNAQGQYTFTNVASGSYKVKVDTSDTDIPNDLKLGTDNDQIVTIANAPINNINFGFNQVPVANICNNLYGSYAKSGATTFSLRQIDPITGASTIIKNNLPGGRGSLSVTPDGKRFYFLGLSNVSPANELKYYDVASDTVISTGLLVSTADPGPFRMAIDPTGTFGYSSRAGVFQRFNLSSNTVTSMTVVDVGPPDLAYSQRPGGDIWFAADGTAYIMARRGGNNPATANDNFMYRMETNGTTVTATFLGEITSSDSRFKGIDANGLAILNGKMYVAGGAAGTNNAQIWTVDLINFKATFVGENTTETGTPPGDAASCEYPNITPNINADKTVTDVNGNDAQPGDILEYTIKVRNSGNISAGNTNLQDPIPAGTTYVVNSTTLNGIAVPDNSDAMPFAAANSINSLGQLPGALLADTTPAEGNDREAIIKFRVKVNTSNPPTKISNQGTINYAGGPSGGVTTDDPSTPDKDATDISISAVASNPNVLLVKRITAVNNQTQNQGSDNLAAYKNETTNPYDDNDISITNPNPPAEPADTNKWPNPNTFLIGGINGGNVRPGDELEYTIYFLSTGDTTAKNVLMCDRIPSNTNFIPNAFNNLSAKADGGFAGADRGLSWMYNGVAASLTNIKDGDTAQYFPPGSDPKTIYPGINCGGENTNGAIVVNLGNLPNATAPGTPTGSYGYVRFRGRVK